MGFVYLAALLLASGCVLLVDRRFRLFFWHNPRRAAAVVGIGTGFFLVWDLVGIGAGIFARGDTEFMTGVLLAPELPVEELFFLAFLCLVTMVLYTGSVRVLDRRAGRAAPEAP